VNIEKIIKNAVLSQEAYSVEEKLCRIKLDPVRPALERISRGITGLMKTWFLSETDRMNLSIYC